MTASENPDSSILSLLTAAVEAARRPPARVDYAPLPWSPPTEREILLQKLRDRWDLPPVETFGAVHSWQEGDLRVYTVAAADGRVARWEKVLPDGPWRKVEGVS